MTQIKLRADATVYIPTTTSSSTPHRHTTTGTSKTSSFTEIDSKQTRLNCRKKKNPKRRSSNQNINHGNSYPSNSVVPNRLQFDDNDTKVPSTSNNHPPQNQQYRRQDRFKRDKGKCKSKKDMNGAKSLRQEEQEDSHLGTIPFNDHSSSSHDTKILATSNPVIYTAQFPALQPSMTTTIHNDVPVVERTKASNASTNGNIWSKTSSIDALRRESVFVSGKEHPMSMDDNTDGGVIDHITKLVPLLQPFHTIRRKQDHETTKQDAISVHDASLTTGSCLSVDLPPSSALLPQIHKISSTTVPFDKLRDRWWNLLQLHEQQQQQNRQRTEEEEILRKDSNEEKLLEPIHQNGTILDANVTNATCKEFRTSKFDDISCTAPFSSGIRNGDQYENTDQPIHEAIHRNDVDGLRQLLLVSGSNALDTLDDEGHMSPLQLAVHLDRPDLVRIICTAVEEKVNTAKSDEDNNAVSSKMAPLLMAVKNGYQQCIRVMLSFFGISSLLTTRDAVGNTAIHCSCCGVESTMFQFLLDYVITSSGYTTSFLFKLLSCRNIQQQTPLHVAAQYGQVDIVDIALNHRSTANISMLSKLLSMPDLEDQTPLLAAVASGSSDVVMSLQMWRGNNYTKIRSTFAPQRLHGWTSITKPVTTSTPCPLSWAVKCKNLDMVSLLLEFNNPTSESGYKLNDALNFSVLNCFESKDITCDSTMLEIIRVLIDAGANPCAIDKEDKHSSTRLSPQSSAITKAAIQQKSTCLVKVLHSYEQYLIRLRHQRRQDPKLRNQPESFFVGIESVENAELTAALRDALLLSLSMARSTSMRDNYASFDGHIKCSLLLYESGVQLRCVELDRLKTYLVQWPRYSLSSEDSIPLPVAPQVPAPDKHFVRPNPSKKDSEQNHFYWSHIMSTLPWYESNSFNHCALLNSPISTVNGSFVADDSVNPDVAILCSDGKLLVSHQVVLAKSYKLAAAIRFASMTKEQNGIDCYPRTNQLLELKVDLTYDTCLRLLEHLYHSSLSSALPTDKSACCLELLELILVGDEYICMSLVHECLLRLLASSDTYNQCFCAFCRENVILLSTNGSSAMSAYAASCPSYLVSAKTTLDVITTLQYVTWSQYDNENCTWTNSSKRPIDALREVALCTAICEFGTLIKSESFVAQFEQNYSGHTEASVAGMLLHMILNDLADIWREQRGKVKIS